MKKIFSVCLFTLFLFSLLTSPVLSQSVDDILNKMIDAMGGRNAIENIKDSTMTGTMELTQMGLSGIVTNYSKRPNKSRMDIEVMGMLITQAYDGETAWMVNPQTGGTEEMPEQMQEEFKRGSIGDEGYLNPKKYGITFTLKGKEIIDGNDCLILEQTFDDGHKTIVYIDSKTYLIYKTKEQSLNQMMVEVEQETIQTDYKKIDGMMVPQTITIFQDGEEFMVMTVTEVTYNTGLKDSFFKME